MNLPASEDHTRAQLRKGVYLLLIVVAAGATTARIMAVNAVDKLALDKYRIAQQLKKDRAKYESKGLSGAALDARSFGTTVADIGDLLLGRYLLAFEVVSVLLLTALIGAILLVREDEPGLEETPTREEGAT